MNGSPEGAGVPAGVGMTSLVIGTIGLGIFFFPVLGIPISAAGMLFGLVALVVTWRTGGLGLRWALSGIAASVLGLAVNVAITYAPAGYLPSRDVPRLWQTPPVRPYVPPPE